MLSPKQSTPKPFTDHTKSYTDSYRGASPKDQRPASSSPREQQRPSISPRDHQQPSPKDLTSSPALPAPSSHLPIRMAPVRLSTETIAKKESPRASPSLRDPPVSSSAAGPRQSPPAPSPHRPELNTLRVKPTEALSPVPKPYPSPSVSRPSSRPSTTSPSPRPIVSSGQPHPLLGLYGGLQGLPGLGGMGYPFPQPPSSSAGGPCTDPHCRDPGCPTYAMRAMQAQLSMHPGLAMGYPYHPGMGLPGSGLGLPGSGLGLPGGGGYPPHMMPPGLHPSLYAHYMSALGAGMSLPPAPQPYLPPSSQAYLPPSSQAYLPPSSQAGPPPPQAFTLPPPPTTQSAGAGLPGGASPFMCSWMQGRDFCGRRFNTSEDLMSHLRSHTAQLAEATPPPQVSASAPSPSAQAGLAMPPSSLAMPPSALALLQAQAAHLRGAAGGATSPRRSTPSASPPVADSRYHPYARPSLPPHLSSPLPPHLANAQPFPYSLGSPLHQLYGGPRPILPVLP